MVRSCVFAAAFVLSLAACGGDGDERREVSRGEYRGMLEALVEAHVDAELELLAEEPGASGDEVEDRLLRSPAVEPAIQKLESAAKEINRAGYGPVQGG